MEKKIARLIASRKGKKQAVTVQNIVNILALAPDDGLTNPVARTAIKNLIRAGMPIASCGNGYYTIETEAELNGYVDSLYGRIAGIQERIDGVIEAFRASRV